jgi:hypothetical protein
MGFADDTGAAAMSGGESSGPGSRPGEGIGEGAGPREPGKTEILASGPDRRSATRYNPDPYVPVLFAHPSAETPTAGLVVDVSNGGARIVAPPTARPMLHWADPLTMIVSYSDSVREAGIEGLRLQGHVVRLSVDSASYLVQVRFDRANGDWTALEGWIHRLADALRPGGPRSSIPTPER